MFQLKLENSYGNVVDINDGVNYLVVDCSGLNPPSASLFTAKSPNRKGVKYNGSTLNERNIVVQIKLLGNVEKNRNALYGWTDTEQYVKVYYRNGVKNVYCEGHVQDCEIEYFTDNEIVSVAIICEDPYWKDLQAISADISLLSRKFKMPFSIGAAGVPFATVRSSTTSSVFYDGAETGVKIVVAFLATVENFGIHNDKDLSKRFIVIKTFNKGDILEIDTESSPKRCRIIHADGTTENGLKYVFGRPYWFKLKRGYNYFSYDSDGDLRDLEVTINFTNKYGGV